MPTNEERREVAARLRDYENLRETFMESAICAFLDVLSLEGYLDWRGVCNSLAELIEPEERTCRNVAAEGVLFECSECGAKTVDAVGNYTQEYCAACGAKVIGAKVVQE